jgi:6-phosphogluconolactonase
LKHLCVFLLLAGAAWPADPLVYVGSYTGSGSKGIYSFRLQVKTGKLTSLGLAAETSNPSFLVEHPNHKYLYTVNENGNASQMGSVTAFSIDSETGRLRQLNWVSSRGGGPCHLAIDSSGRWLAVANYEGGSIAVFPLLPDGRLGEAASFSKTGSHAHCVLFAPGNAFLLAADLGLDAILVYKFDASDGHIAPASAAAVKHGSGVRHLAFHPNGKALYALNEKSSTVTVFSFDSAAGTLSDLQTLPTLPAFSPHNAAAEIAMNADATLLYVSNRGHDSIYTFNIDPDRLVLSPQADFPTLGNTPRHFAIDPSGQILIVANQDSNDLAVFKIHARTGQLTPAGKLVTGVSKPACVLFAGH